MDAIQQLLQGAELEVRSTVLPSLRIPLGPPPGGQAGVMDAVLGEVRPTITLYASNGSQLATFAPFGDAAEGPNYKFLALLGVLIVAGGLVYLGHKL